MVCGRVTRVVEVLGNERRFEAGVVAKGAVEKGDLGIVLSGEHWWRLVKWRQQRRQVASSGR